MWSAKPDRSEPDHAETNQGLLQQTVLWGLCSSEILCSLEWKLLTNVLGQGSKNQKREHSMSEINWHSLLFWYFVCFWHNSPQWAMASSFTRFLDHTRRITVGRTSLDEWSARRRDLYLKSHNTHNRRTSMPPVGFEPTVSAASGCRPTP